MIITKTIEIANSPSKYGDQPMLRVTRYKLLSILTIYKKIEEVKDGGKIKR